MSHSAHQIDGVNATGHLDVFVDTFVASFDYAGGDVTFTEIGDPLQLTHDEVFHFIQTLEEWLEMVKMYMPSVSHPQPSYSFEIEHGGGKVKFKFTHEASVVRLSEYDLNTKLAIISPRPEQVLTLRAFFRYAEALRRFVDDIDLYK